MSQAALLKGIVVLDSTQVMAGPYCAMLMADMGATVIKIEPPDGDSTRRMAGAVGSDSAAFGAVNRGKQSLILNLAVPAARDVFKRLSRTADIVVENYRPGVMAKMGLDYATLSAENPRLIYASISGYGQTGPSASKGGFDLVAQGESGLMSVTGERGRPPIKTGVPLTDLGAGLFALAGILAALHHRAATGRGQQIDTSLFEAGMALAVWEATEFLSGRGVPRPLGSAHRMSAPYQAFRCSDGYITVGAASDRMFARLAALLGHDEWTRDRRFTTNTERVANSDVLASLIEEVTAKGTCAEWLSRLEQAGIPGGPINDLAQAFAHPQAVAREMSVAVDHPVLGPMRQLGTPIKMSAAPLNPHRRAPMLGEHTDAVLAWAGYSTDEVEMLRVAGAAL
jgi:formyl-CoA transferase